MSKILLDDTLRSKLNGLNERLELCDATGRTVGHFLPDEMYKKMMCAWANAQVTDEELEQSFQEPGGRTLAEIWQDLGQS